MRNVAVLIANGESTLYADEVGLPLAQVVFQRTVTLNLAI